MFESLSDKLEGALQNVKGQGRISDVNIAESMREIRRALLDADVNYQVARDFTDRVREQATGEDVLTSVTPGEQLTKIVHDELVELLGGEQAEVNMADQPPTVVLVAGLQGSGKTTFCAKLARHFKLEGHSPVLAAAYCPCRLSGLVPKDRRRGRSTMELNKFNRSTRDVNAANCVGTRVAISPLSSSKNARCGINGEIPPKARKFALCRFCGLWCIRVICGWGFFARLTR